MRSIQTFGFKRAKEILHSSVVIRTTRARHGWREVVFLTQVKVCFGCVLRPLVAVECESTSDLFLYHSISDSICHKRRRHIVANAPCQHRTSTQIQYCAHIKHSTLKRNVCDICHPELIRLLLTELPVKQILILKCVLLVMSIWSPAPDLRKSIQLSHNPKYRFKIHLLVFGSSQPSFNASAAIGIVAFLLAFHNQVNQPLIFRRLLQSLSPRVVSASRYNRKSQILLFIFRLSKMYCSPTTICCE